MITIKPHHIRAAGLCITGARPWLIRHGWTMADLRHEKITAERLEEIGDGLANRVARAARLEQQE